MSNELTPKQEKFAQKYIELGNAAEAYREAYDAENMKPVTVRRKAAELLEHGIVSARIRAMREALQERHMVTLDSITRELEESRKLATADRQHSAAINASLGKAKLHGLIVDKNELSGRLSVTNHEEALKQLDDDPA
jgi:phage terminase small subunit